MVSVKEWLLLYVMFLFTLDFVLGPTFQSICEESVCVFTFC